MERFMVIPLRLYAAEKAAPVTLANCAPRVCSFPRLPWHLSSIHKRVVDGPQAVAKIAVAGADMASRLPGDAVGFQRLAAEDSGGDFHDPAMRDTDAAYDLVTVHGGSWALRSFVGSSVRRREQPLLASKVRRRTS